MKRKSNFFEERVGDFFYLYPSGENVDGKIFSMNDSCKYVWDLLKDDLSESQVIAAVSSYYGIECEVLTEDIKEILSEMYKAGVIDI